MKALPKGREILPHAAQRHPARCLNESPPKRKGNAVRSVLPSRAPSGLNESPSKQEGKFPGAGVVS